MCGLYVLVYVFVFVVCVGACAVRATVAAARCAMRSDPSRRDRWSIEEREEETRDTRGVRNEEVVCVCVCVSSLVVESEQEWVSGCREQCNRIESTGECEQTC